MLQRRDCRRRRHPLAAIPTLFIIITLLLSLTLTLTVPTTTSKHTIILALSPPIIFAEAATNVQWRSNENVSPEDKAAHDAPRSQKYWDEHGIKRPKYAKTDAEIAAERWGVNGEGDSRGIGFVGIILMVAGVITMAAVLYARITGDWDTILNNPVGAFITTCIHNIMEITGVKGHRLGSSSSTTAAAATNVNGVSDENARLARLARFDTPKNILDNIKSD
mmetsp:Transcript_14583/g.31723  ORF Transcript_14583/g.31723 Transcript_14583/m.31723 type:complete len:221 (-) Transcript_14583:14-676(-)